MTNLENIKSIRLNGNVATRIAQNYSRNSLNKSASLLTVNAGQELVTKTNKLRKLILNEQSNAMTCHKVFNQDTGRLEIREDVYDLLIEVNEADNTFDFVCSNSNRIKIYENEFYLSKQIYMTDSSKSYTLRGYKHDLETTLYFEIMVKDCNIHCGDYYPTITLDIKNSYANNDGINLNIDKPFLQNNLVYNSINTNDNVSITVLNSFDECDFTEPIEVDEKILIHIGKRFFDYIDLDNAVVGIFGDWNNFKGTILIDANGLNTAETTYLNIIALLKSVMKLNDDVNIAFENRWFL